MLQFWTDDRQHITCCQFEQNEDQLEADSDLFDCEQCPVADHLTRLDIDNRRAWELGQLVCSRFLGDAQAIGPVLNRLTPDLDAEDFSDLLQRLNLLYDALCPPPAQTK